MVTIGAYRSPFFIDVYANIRMTFNKGGSKNDQWGS